MRLSPDFLPSRVCPASCPAFKSLRIDAVPRVPCLVTTSTPPLDRHKRGSRAVGVYIGKNAGRRGTRDKSIAPNWFRLHHWRREDSITME